MRIAWLVLVAACGGSSCPTVDELLKGNTDAESRRDSEITVKICRDDHWSASVMKCLRAAQTYDSEVKCFAELSAAQQAKLKAAFDSVVDSEAAGDMRAHDETFGQELATLGLDKLAARAPACAGYADEIAAARKTLLACPKHDALAMFGMQQETKQQLHDLAAITDDAQLAAGCAKDRDQVHTWNKCN